MTITNERMQQEMGLSPDVSLYPFQLECLNKFVEQPNVLIGDDMGVGKTFEGVGRDLYLRTVDPVGRHRTLVVAPLSVLESWERHFRMMTNLKVRVIDPKKRFLFFRDTDDVDVFIIHWEALRLVTKELGNLRWFHIIADECHKMQNRKAKMTQALKTLRPPYKTAMSGTAVTNRPDNIWSVLNWIKPGEYASYWKFYERYVDFETDHMGFHKVLGAKNLDELRKKMAPFYIRRDKEEVLHDLPSKYWSETWVDLDPKQRRAYDSMAEEMLAWIGQNEDTPLVAPVAIARLIRLQQLAMSHGEIIYDDDGASMFMPSMPSSKYDALKEHIDSTNQQLVVFSNFTKMLNMVQRQLLAAGVSSVLYTGEQAHKARDIKRQEFVDGKHQVLLMNIKAGGVGVDGLQHACSTVIFLDRDWSPAINKQAEDRLHRDGQKSPVQVIDIMARNTVDLGRKQKLHLKWTWMKELLRGH